MRIAISGSHRTGKSTLVEALADALPKYRSVEEPYYLLEEDGHEPSHPPSLEDFEAQLDRSLAELGERRNDVVFDRCPLDFLAYLTTHEDAESFDLDDWLPRVREAVQTLDLVVFVPIEDPDRIADADDDDDDSRTPVDEALRDILLNDSLSLDLNTLTVEGSTKSRLRGVLERITSR